jgi:hypothetical protein
MIPARVGVVSLRNRAGIVVGHALVDAEDLEWASRWTWCLNANGYAWRNSRGEPGEAKHVYLHRALLGLRAGDRRQVDHINRDKLDDRRVNLRIATDATNRQNTPAIGGSSQYRGVHFDRSRGRWTASAQLNRQGHHLGRFATEQEAAAVAAAWRAKHMPFSHDADDFTPPTDR